MNVMQLTKKHSMQLGKKTTAVRDNESNNKCGGIYLERKCKVKCLDLRGVD